MTGPEDATGGRTYVVRLVLWLLFAATFPEIPRVDVGPGRRGPPSRLRAAAQALGLRGRPRRGGRRPLEERVARGPAVRRSLRHRGRRVRNEGLRGPPPTVGHHGDLGRVRSLGVGPAGPGHGDRPLPRRDQHRARAAGRRRGARVLGRPRGPDRMAVAESRRPSPHRASAERAPSRPFVRSTLSDSTVCTPRHSNRVIGVQIGNETVQPPSDR